MHNVSRSTTNESRQGFLFRLVVDHKILWIFNPFPLRFHHRKFEATEKVWENHIRALLFCSLLEIYPTCVRINQKFRFKSHSLQTFPLVNSHDDQNVVIEPFQHQLISRVKIGHQPRSLCVHTCAVHCTREKTSHSLKYNKKLRTRCRSNGWIEKLKKLDKVPPS